MNFIKKNLILFIYICIAFVSSIVLIVFILKASKQYTKYDNLATKQLQTASKIKKGRISPTKKNQDIAHKNKELVKKHLNTLSYKLENKFNLATEVQDGMDCVRTLRDSCIGLVKKLNNAEIEYDSDIRYFTFKDVAESQSIPPKELVIMILKQLKVITELVNIFTKSKVSYISQISWNNSREVIDKGIFLYMPISLKFSGSHVSIHKFINYIYKAKYFFIIRNLTFKSSQKTYQKAILDTLDSFNVINQKVIKPEKDKRQAAYMLDNMNSIGESEEQEEESGQYVLSHSDIFTVDLQLDLVIFNITEKK